MSKYDRFQEHFKQNMLEVLGDWRKDTPSSWYKDWGELLYRSGGKAGLTAEQSYCLFAAFSPNKSVARNWHMFMQALREGPEHVSEALPRAKAMACAVVGSDNPYMCLSGPKVTAFAKALSGDNQAVTIDRLMAQAAFNDPTRSCVPKGAIKPIQLAVKEISCLVGWKPSETQATIWSCQRARRVNGGRGISKNEPNPLVLLSEYNPR